MNNKAIVFLVTATTVVGFVVGKNAVFKFLCFFVIFCYFKRSALGILIGVYAINENENLSPANFDAKPLLINEISAEQISKNLRFEKNCSL